MDNILRADIPRFLARRENTGADLVVGTRTMTIATMPWLRLWANRSMSACLSLYAGRALPDSQCGFRLVDGTRSACQPERRRTILNLHPKCS